jgi:type VI secretion system protein ImpM
VTGAWLFGKLPAHGDFVSRGIAPDERDALDLWLAGSLAQAREALGYDFDDLYEEAPPWRFAWAHPDGWTAGAMALSVDGVGRRYPILVAHAGVDADGVEGAADLAENLLYEALGGGWDADRLHGAVAAATPESLGTWEGGEGWWTLGAERFNESYLVGARPTGLMTAVLTPVAAAMDEDATNGVGEQGEA